MPRNDPLPKQPGGNGFEGMQAVPLGVWAKVLDRHSEDNTVDIETSDGINAYRIPVASRDWIFSGDAVGGTRDLPPPGSYVFVLLPDGRFETGFVLCSGIPRRNDTALRSEFLQSGKESEKKSISEGGWKQTEDSESGDILIEDDAGFEMKVERSSKSIEIKDWSGGTTRMNSEGIKIADSFGNEVTLGAAGIEIKTIRGKITGGIFSMKGISAPDGQGPFCALPLCFLTGAPHVGSEVVGT